MDRPWLKSYPPGVPAEFEFPDIPVPKLLDDAVREYPSKVAVDFQGVTWTYRQLGEQVDKFASVLRDLGVKKGTRVGTITPNIPQMVVAYYATAF